MPSFYEPFGSASEGFKAGTPVLARATGGLWQQVRSVLPCAAPSFYQGLFQDGTSSPETANGILFREQFEHHNDAGEWRYIFSLLPEQRTASALYCSMVDATYEALIAAIDLFSRKEDYSVLIFNGITGADRFNWSGVVDKYRQVYDCISRASG
jgi:glycogen synthase